MEVSLRDRALSIWHVQRVKRLVRDRLGAGVQCIISVRETICTDPGCEGPAIEIRVVTLGFQEITAVVHGRVSEVSSADVARAI